MVLSIVLYEKGGIMQENTDDKGSKPSDLYIYGLRNGQVASTIAIGRGDLTILQMYKSIFKKPMVAVLHDMIGTAAKCWEERHIRIIKQMEEKLRTDEKIIMEYLQRFGRIRPHSAALSQKAKTIRE